ncbi:MAG: DUF502 domain-containing protein [Elusimicrobiota bacterium]|jgi:uncharacterized membrane protein
MRLLLQLRRQLITGFLIVGPAGISAYLLVWVVGTVDGLLAGPAHALIGHRVPGLGFATALGILFVVGSLASNFFGRQLLESVEELMLRIPVFNGLYRTLKRMTDAFAPGQGQFRSVVLVEYPRPGVRSLGFVTGRTAWGEGPEAELVAVFVPTNNLYIGDIVLVPKGAVSETGLTLEQGVQAVLSAGSALPSRIPPK